jgi:hypothetical protein
MGVSGKIRFALWFPSVTRGTYCIARQYLESQLTVAHLPVAHVHSGLRALVALGPEHVHGFRQLGVERRLVRVV